MKIGVIGVGAIGAPLARHLAAKGHEVWVSARGRSAELASDTRVHVGENQDVVDAADVVALCLRPQVATDVLEPLNFREGQRVISVMAAVPRARLAALCGPVTDVVQTMPFEYLDQGGCPLPAFGNHALLDGLFAPENLVIPVASEAALNAHFAACTGLPLVLDVMATAADWLGAKTGDASAAEAYVKALIAGYLAARDGTAAQERDALATDGTLSLRMTRAVQDTGVHEVMRATMDAIEEGLAR